MKHGDQFRAAHGVTTLHAAFDFETYSAAGMVWNGVKWESPRGCGAQTRGIKAVGAYNYIAHESFEVLSLAYDLLDGAGIRHWVPRMTEFGLSDEPHDLIAHIGAGKIISAWNIYFEFLCWNLYCVPKFGWPTLAIGQCRCDMAKAQVMAYPAALENAGAILLPAHLQKDKAGGALIRKLTVPQNPSKKLEQAQARLV